MERVEEFKKLKKPVSMMRMEEDVSDCKRRVEEENGNVGNGRKQDF